MHKICWITITLTLDALVRFGGYGKMCAATQQFAGKDGKSDDSRPRRNMKNDCTGHGRCCLRTNVDSTHSSSPFDENNIRSYITRAKQGKAIKWQAEQRNGNNKMGIKISPAQMMSKSFSNKMRWSPMTGHAQFCSPSCRCGNMKHRTTVLYKRQQWF